MLQQEIDSLVCKFCNLDSSLVTAIALDCSSVQEAESVLEPLNCESVATHAEIEEDCFSHDGTDSTGKTAFAVSDDFKEAQRLQMIENYHGNHERIREEENETRSLRKEIEDTDLDLTTYMTIRRMFPHVPAIKVKLRMKKYPEMSVEDLMEYFLNYDTLKEVAPDEFMANVEVLSRPCKPPKLKHQGDSNRAQRGAALVQLTPLRRVPYWDDYDDTEPPDSGGSQCWNMFNNDIKTLSTLLNLPKPSVAKYYYACNVSMAKTIIAILADFKADELTDADQEYVFKSTETFKNVPFEYLERLYLLLDRDEERYAQAANIIAAYDDKWNDMLGFRFVGEASTVIPDADTKLPSVPVPAPSTVIPIKPVSVSSPSVDPDGYQQVSGRKSARLKTVSELQELAVRLEQTRKSYLYKSTTQPALRGYYRGVIADLEEKRRQADTEAKLLQKIRMEGAYYTDLHGLTVNEAMDLMESKIDAWWALEKINYEKHAPVRELKIVTGAGNHSHNGVPKIKNSVSMWLKSHGWVYHSNTASLEVVGRRRL